MLYQLGHPVNESEMVRHLINGGPVNMFEDVEPIGNDFLNRIFKDGTQGELYRTTYMFFYKDSGEGANMRNSTFSLNYGDNPLNYKIVWSKRTREAEDDYTALMAMLRTMGGTSYTEADVRRHLDLEMTFKNWALRGYARTRTPSAWAPATTASSTASPPTGSLCASSGTPTSPSAASTPKSRKATGAATCRGSWTSRMRAASSTTTSSSCWRTTPRTPPR